MFVEQVLINDFYRPFGPKVFIAGAVKSLAVVVDEETISVLPLDK